MGNNGYKLDKANAMIIQYLDEDFELSTTKLLENGWFFVPIYEYLNPMQAEWISQAVGKIYPNQKIIAIDVEYKSVPRVVEFEPERDNIMQLLFESTGYVLLSNENENFLYYKDQLNRFSVICGSNDFLTLAYPCSIGTMRIMYDYYWQDDQSLPMKEKEYYENIWKKYNKLPNNPRCP